MDGCASHSDDLVGPKGQVTVMTYPPNYTSKHQPMDMDIISVTKRLYRLKLLRIHVSTTAHVRDLREQAKEQKMVASMAGFAKGHSFNPRDAAEILRDAWNDISATSITK